MQNLKKFNLADETEGEMRKAISVSVRVLKILTCPALRLCLNFVLNFFK